MKRNNETGWCFAKAADVWTAKGNVATGSGHKNLRPLLKAAIENGLVERQLPSGGYGRGSTTGYRVVVQAVSAEQWGMVPNTAIKDKQLNDAPFRLLCIIAAHQPRDGWAFPGEGTLAKLLHLEDTTANRKYVRRLIRRLATSGYLATGTHDRTKRPKYRVAVPPPGSGLPLSGGECALTTDRHAIINRLHSGQLGIPKDAQADGSPAADYAEKGVDGVSKGSASRIPKGVDGVSEKGVDGVSAEHTKEHTLETHVSNTGRASARGKVVAREIAADPAFDTFWRLYPRKVNRRAAEPAWSEAARKEDAATILRALARQIKNHHLGEDLQKIPHPANWLERERWTDEVEVLKPNLYGGL